MKRGRSLRVAAAATAAAVDADLGAAAAVDLAAADLVSAANLAGRFRI
jgi:hypothetical protein